MSPFIDQSNQFTKTAKENILQFEGGPLFLSNWLKVVFIHFEVDRELLQKAIPFELDLFEGKAYVTLVAFNIRGLRPKLGEKYTSWIQSPLANHQYFNVRTYVRHGEMTGIYFIEEWLSSKLSAVIGSFMYGLPYRHGYLNYQNSHTFGHLYGYISPYDLTGHFIYQSKINAEAKFETFAPETLGEYLGERYVAFAGKNPKRRMFRVWHKPWMQIPIKLSIEHDSLFPDIGEWGKTAKFKEAHYSPGVYDVWIGKPHYV